jgi:hypothetical protein
MKVLRKITQKSLRDKFRSSGIRGGCEIEHVNKWINNKEQNGMNTLIELEVAE